MTSLSSLIAELTAAQEGSRELDCLIAIHPATPSVGCIKSKTDAPNDLLPRLLGDNPFGDTDEQLRERGHPKTVADAIGVPNYSTSLDAAMTLVPKGFAWSVFSNRRLLTPNDPDTFGAWVETMQIKKGADGMKSAPLALVIASLRAIESMKRRTPE